MMLKFTMLAAIMVVSELQMAHTSPPYSPGVRVVECYRRFRVGVGKRVQISDERNNATPYIASYIASVTYFLHSVRWAKLWLSQLWQNQSPGRTLAPARPPPIPPEAPIIPPAMPPMEADCEPKPPMLPKGGMLLPIGKRSAAAMSRLTPVVPKFELPPMPAQAGPMTTHGNIVMHAIPVCGTPLRLHPVDRVGEYKNSF